MNWKWLAFIGAANIFAGIYAVGNLLVDFAILAPGKLQFDVGNVESVKAAIFQAESMGIEAMRKFAVSGSTALASAMILNFFALCLVVLRKKQLV